MVNCDGISNSACLSVDAVRLGGVDVLPKAFEGAPLRAQIRAALRRKRDRELDRSAG